MKKLIDKNLLLFHSYCVKNAEVDFHVFWVLIDKPEIPWK